MKKEPDIIIDDFYKDVIKLAKQARKKKNKNANKSN